MSFENKQDDEHSIGVARKDNGKINRKRKRNEFDQDVGDSSLCNEASETMKKKKRRRKKKSLPSSVCNEASETKEKKSLPSSVCNEASETKKKKKKKRRKKKKSLPSSVCNEASGTKKEQKSLPSPVCNEASETKKKKKKKRRKKKSLPSSSSDHVKPPLEDNDITYVEIHQGRKEKMKKDKKKKKTEKAQEDMEEKKQRSAKKVTFSSNITVFPYETNKEETNLVHGKWFTPEEDEMVKESVHKYIIEHNLGEKGLDMIMHSGRHRRLRNCWKEIGKALPHRPAVSVYYRAHILFERAETHTWSEEDLELVRQFHAEHGAKWKQLAEITGRHRLHIKDAWRRIKSLERKSGTWSQDEYQKLHDLVHIDLRLRVFGEKKSKHGMLRDNIGWVAISDMLKTRTDPACCHKWYRQLTSPMVEEGIWADTDDYRLLAVLFELDACSVEEVDWDNVLEHRSGEVCRRRWNQMVRHIGSKEKISFQDQVEILSNRYKLDLLEAREIWDNKPYTC